MGNFAMVTIKEIIRDIVMEATRYDVEANSNLDLGSDMVDSIDFCFGH